jgi:hypothetical protein
MINSDVTKSTVHYYLNILNQLGHLTIGKDSTIKKITILSGGTTLALVKIANSSGETSDVALENLLRNTGTIDNAHPDYKFVGQVLHDIERSILEVRSKVATYDPKAAEKSPSRIGIILTSVAAKVYSKFNRPKSSTKAPALTMTHEVAQVSIASSADRSQLLKIASVFHRSSILIHKQSEKISELEAQVKELEEAAQSSGVFQSIKQSALSALSLIRARL